MKKRIVLGILGLISAAAAGAVYMLRSHKRETPVSEDERYLSEFFKRVVPVKDKSLTGFFDADFYPEKTKKHHLALHDTDEVNSYKNDAWVLYTDIATWKREQIQAYEDECNYRAFHNGPLPNDSVYRDYKSFMHAWKNGAFADIVPKLQPLRYSCMSKEQLSYYEDVIIRAILLLHIRCHGYLEDEDIIRALGCTQVLYHSVKRSIGISYGTAIRYPVSVDTDRLNRLLDVNNTLNPPNL